MGILGFPLGGPLGGYGALIAPLLPQTDTDTLSYSDGLGLLPQNDTGTDVSTLAQLSGDWNVQGGDAMLAEDMLRRLTTPRGTLDFSPNDGIDVRDLLRDDMGQSEVFQSKQAVENELQKDERVDDVDVIAAFTAATATTPNVLQLSMLVTKASGSFRLVLDVTKLTVDVLSAEVA